MEHFKERIKDDESIAKRRSNDVVVLSDLNQAVLLSSTQARQALSYNLAIELKVLPLALESVQGGYELLYVGAATDEPDTLITTLKFVTDKDIRLVPADPAWLPQAIFKAYHGDESYLTQNLSRGGDFFGSERKALSTNLTVVETKVGRTEELLSRGDVRAARIIRVLIDYAIARDASDLHLFPQEQGAYASIRLNGILYSHDGCLCDLPLFTQIISLIKILAQLDTTVRRRAQDGAFGYRYIGKVINIRVSLMPTIYGEKVVLRFLGSNTPKGLDSLSLPVPVVTFLNRFMDGADGLCLLCGPTGGGKSTTMYSMINALKERNLSISTVEDPVEIYLPGIAQTEVSETNGMTYTNCLRSLLRQDPDVILLGEIRDRSSAKVAIHAAQTGHLILSTIHGRTVFDGLKRLRLLSADTSAIADSLKLIVWQKLVPRLCARCKVVDLNISRLAQRYRDLEIRRIYRPGSCEECGYSGFAGRLPITQALCLDSDLRLTLSQGNFDNESLKKYLTEKNYYSLEHSVKLLLEQGEISPSEVVT